MTKIKRTNVRYMTWICLAILLLVGVKVAIWGLPTGSEETVGKFMQILGLQVLAYAGISVAGDTLNAHSERKSGS